MNDHSYTDEVLESYRNHVDIRVELFDYDPSSDMSCGPSKARNTAMSFVDKKYVISLDDDNLFEPTYLE